MQSNQTGDQQLRAAMNVSLAAGVFERREGVLWRSAIVLLWLTTSLLLPAAIHAAQTVTCGQAPNLPSYPEGYAPPFDPQTEQPLVEATCLQGEETGEGGGSVTLTLGDGENHTAVYHTVYAWDGAQWQPYTVEGSHLDQEKKWVVRQGSVSIPLSSVASWVVGYVCKWDEQEQRWRCGCRDSACTTSGWQVLYVAPPGVPSYCATHECPLPPGAPFIDFVDSTSEAELRQKFPRFSKKVFRTAYNMGVRNWDTLLSFGVLQDLAKWINSDSGHWAQYVIELFPWRYPEPTSKQYEVSAIQAQFNDCLAGKFDTYYRKLGEQIRAAGIRDRFVLSVGPEWNFGHVTASVSRNPSLLSPLYAQCFNRAIKQIRAGAGNSVRLYIAWIGGGAWNEGLVRATYPGDGVIDIIGTDIYDIVSADCSAFPKYSTGWQECRWNAFLNNYLSGWQRFAKERGKWFAIPEWGLWPTNDPPYNTLTTWDSDDNRNYGGGDNAVFIRNMCNWVKQQDNVLYALYFRYHSSHLGLTITNYPQAMKAFNEYCAQ